MSLIESCVRSESKTARRSTTSPRMGPRMTTFAAHRDALEEKTAVSVEIVEEGRPRLGPEYLMVLQELASGERLGTAAVYASCDVELPTLANDTGTTEVGSLAARSIPVQVTALRRIAQSASAQPTGEFLRDVPCGEPNRISLICRRPID